MPFWPVSQNYLFEDAARIFGGCYFPGSRLCPWPGGCHSVSKRLSFYLFAVDQTAQFPSAFTGGLLRKGTSNGHVNPTRAQLF